MFKQTKAFTLAEVLITLGIIGVVAALTLPTLIQNYQEKANVTKLKKAYSILSQAMASAVNENGPADIWDIYSFEKETADGETGMYYRYTPVNIIKQLKITKDCGFKSEGCFHSEYTKLNGNKERDFENDNNGYYKLLLSDGMAIAFQGYEPDVCAKPKGNCGEIWVDINGHKRPNVVGKDLFIFNYTKDKIVMYGEKAVTENYLKRTTCNLKSYGYACTAWVILKENLDYLHCDDLSWSGKFKCN